MSVAIDDLEWAGYADEVGRRLITVRKAQRVTQESLALAAGLSRNQIQNIEQSRSSAKASAGNATIRTIFILARALGVPPAFLIPSVNDVPLDSNLVEEQAWPSFAVALTAETQLWPLPPGTRTSSRLK